MGPSENTTSSVLKTPEQLRIRERQQSVVADLGRRSLLSPDISSLFDEAVRLVAETLEVDYCTILEMLPNNEAMLVRAGIGWNAGVVGHATVSAGAESMAGYTLLVNEPVVVSNLPEETRFQSSELLTEHGVISGASVIIRGRQSPFGVMSAFAARPLSFTADDVYFMRGVANVVAAAIEREKAEERIRIQRDILSQVSDTIIAANTSNEITFWNSAAERLYGITEAEATGKNLDQVVQTAWLKPEDALDCHRMLAERGAWHGQVLNCKKNGAEMVVDISITLMRNERGRLTGQLNIVRDITERRRAAEALARSKADMETLNRRLRQAMMETHHRVKNNLQLIAAMMDIRLMEHPETISTDEYRRLALHVHMLSVVHDILTHEAKDDGQALSLNAGETLERLMPILQQTASGRVIEYHFADAELTARQGSSLALIVNELVSNSIKYGRGKICVETRRTDKELLLIVSDDGPGFGAGFLSGGAQGTGVELIVHLSKWDLGGSAIFENRAEGGARVTIYIPLHAPSEALLAPAK